VRAPRKVHLNPLAVYFRGTGCVRFANGAVVELTVAEEELFELLLGTPKITVPWDRMEYELARSSQTIRHLIRGLRDKLGSRSIRTHTGRGTSLQPQFIGGARFALARQQAQLGEAPMRLRPEPTLSRLASVSR
jgi:DNA-binding response OmpR family regulator